MNNEPLVSVIIPCYNCEKYIEKSIFSIINQTYKNMEILIAEDGSTDNTLDILNKLAGKDSRIQIIKNENNLGIVDTLNKLVSIAKGKYIARMDADDYSFPNRIKEQVFLLESNPDITICSSDAYLIDGNGRIYDKMFMPHSSQEIEAYKQVNSPFIHPAVTIRANLIKDFKYDKNYQYAEDYELWLRILSKNKGINLNKFLLCYRVLSNSISHDKNTKSKQELLCEKLQTINQEKYHAIIKNKDISLKTKELITGKYTRKNVYLLLYYINRIFSKLIVLRRLSI